MPLRLGTEGAQSIRVTLPNRAYRYLLRRAMHEGSSVGALVRAAVMWYYFLPTDGKDLPPERNGGKIPIMAYGDPKEVLKEV